MSGTSSLLPPPVDQDDRVRLFQCARCGIEVGVCAPCDRGQIYCAGECRVIRRRESRRRSAAKYQRTRRGARKHAARQSAWRLANLSIQKVTHHGFPDAPQEVIVTVPAPAMSACASMEDLDGTVADDTADGSGLEVTGDEPGGRRSDQGALTRSAPHTRVRC
jgi:hypothetical protein